MNIKSIAMTATASLAALSLAATLTTQSTKLAAQTTELPAPAADMPTHPSASKVRIVRLSQAKGEVQLDRGNGRGFEPAITNLPVVEKSRLQTGVGIAEIEFEDNSSLRVLPYSIVEFPALERLPGGTTVSSIHLVKGTAYASLMKTPGNEFNLLFGNQNLRLPGGSHIRLELKGEEATLAVLDGSVHLERTSGVMDVPRKKSVTFRMNDASLDASTDTRALTAVKAFEANPFDAWDHNSVEYHARYAASSAMSGSSYAYGSSDMAYYGNFASYGGCGSMWRPYFASADWDPYSNGSFAWYQGAGYSWVSPYPWGWTPYHSGAWTYCQGTGWGWMPGGSWQGLNNTAVMTNTRKLGYRPIAPVHPPRPSEPTLRAVNLTPLVRSEAASGSFLFRKDSAGLGIPREELGKLNKFSEHAIQKGSVSTEIHIESLSSTGARGPAGSGNLAPTSIRRGASAPQGGGPQGGLQSGRSGMSGASSSPAVSSSGMHPSSSSPAPSHH